MRNARLATEAKDAQALALAAMGKTVSEIAVDLDYASHSGASKAISRALGRKQSADAELHRGLQLSRLETYRRSLLPLLSGRNEARARAVEVLVKIEEREAKLLGLDIAEPAVTLTQENLTIVVAANVNVEAI